MAVRLVLSPVQLLLCPNALPPLWSIRSQFLTRPFWREGRSGVLDRDAEVLRNFVPREDFSDTPSRYRYHRGHNSQSVEHMTWQKGYAFHVWPLPERNLESMSRRDATCRLTVIFLNKVTGPDSPSRQWTGVL